MQLTLQQLVPGDRAVITGYDRTMRAMRERLLALGLTRGAAVHVTRTAPTGCPIELRVRGASIVLRRTEARALLVSREEAVQA